LAAAAVLVFGTYLSYTFYRSHSDRRVAEEQTALLDAVQREKAEGLRSQAEAALAVGDLEAAGARIAELDRLPGGTSVGSSDLRKRYEAKAGERETNKRYAAASVAREEVKCPVAGEAWTSPATDMEFVWVTALKLWVGKYDVTNGEYRKKDAGHDSKDYQGHTLNSDRQPVVEVNFDDAKAYAEWLTGQDRERLGGLRYRVVSEAEWQACAQCGDGREYPWGNAMPPKYGNYSDSASPLSVKIAGYTDGFAVTCPVERSGVNEWGLYGLGGNMWEGCASDASGGSFGAWRGASWNDGNPDCIRCAFRLGLDGSTRGHGLGFRLVLSR